MAAGVLLVSNLFDRRRGSWGVCLELAEQLRQAGWRVLTTSDWTRRRWRPLDMVWTAWSRRNAYDVAHIDVFSGTAFRWAEAVSAVVRRARKPVVLSLHGGNLPAFHERHPQRVAALLQSADRVTTPSHYLLDAMVEARADIQLVPNPLTLENYTFRARRHPEPRLLWLRSFHEMYNPTMAVEAIARLRDEHPSVCLRMVGFDRGDGALQRTRAVVDALHLADHVEIHDGVPKSWVPDVLTRADIFLNTSNIDNTPISVLEACATGLCVVSTDVGGIPYVLEDGRDALLVRPDSADAMAHAVHRILEEPALAGGLSQRARETAEAHGWRTILPQWDGLLRELMTH